MAIHNVAPILMAHSIFRGACSQRILESWEKKAKKGILMPAWWKTPAEAKRSISQIARCPSLAAACITIDLLLNPLKSRKAGIDEAPTMQKLQVYGIDLCRPPRSEPLILPVW